MKRSVMISAITVLSEIGAWAVCFFAGAALTEMDLLAVMVIASMVSGGLALAIWQALENEMSPRAATRKAQNK